MTLVTRVSTNPLPGINVSWHDRCIDVLSLQRTKRFNSGVYEIQYNGVPCVAKLPASDGIYPELNMRHGYTPF